MDWGTFMSSHCDVVYVKLDVRGARGQVDRSLYHQIGGVEVQDQVTVLEYLLDKYKYLDQTRVGMWGWGYGGYVTTMALGLGNQQKVYKCGIAVSPISDWLYYSECKIVGDVVGLLNGFNHFQIPHLRNGFSACRQRTIKHTWKRTRHNEHVTFLRNHFFCCTAWPISRRPISMALPWHVPSPKTASSSNIK